MLRIMALLGLAATVVAVVLIWTAPLWPEAAESDPATAPIVRTEKIMVTIGVCGLGALGAGLLLSLSLLVRYCYHSALNGAAGRAQTAQERHEGARPAAESDLGERTVLLLEEINENTLLNDQDKARKRARLADLRRERLRKEIEQLIAATKWQVARTRIEELRKEYPDDEDVKELARRLEAAIAEHREVDVMTTSEQIRSYMSLGLWEKAREAAAQLAAKYPRNAEAQKMADVVRLEQEGFRKDERSRLYREIEHLVARKHYRDARKVAETLIERHADSPEAATLKGQMDELGRNADIETRREMESQIIEYEKQGRHKEAYEVARLLMEQYPESPQAVALQDTIERLRERAGLN
jgi:tetratricopeptide (TPR) repeat protein